MWRYTGWGDLPGENWRDHPSCFWEGAGLLGENNPSRNEGNFSLWTAHDMSPPCASLGACKVSAWEKMKKKTLNHLDGCLDDDPSWLSPGERMNGLMDQETLMVSRWWE